MVSQERVFSFGCTNGHGSLLCYCFSKLDRSSVKVAANTILITPRHQHTTTPLPPEIRNLSAQGTTQINSSVGEPQMYHWGSSTLYAGVDLDRRSRPFQSCNGRRGCWSSSSKPGQQRLKQNIQTIVYIDQLIYHDALLTHNYMQLVY